MSEHQRLADLAEKHLWGHFSVLKNDIDGTRVIERGMGCHVWDAEGNRYLDGLAGLFVSQLVLYPSRCVFSRQEYLF